MGYSSLGPAFMASVPGANCEISVPLVVTVWVAAVPLWNTPIKLPKGGDCHESINGPGAEGMGTEAVSRLNAEPRGTVSKPYVQTPLGLRTAEYWADGSNWAGASQATPSADPRTTAMRLFLLTGTADLA